MDEKTLRLFEGTDWRVIRRELLAYVTWRAHHYWWYRGHDLELTEGATVEDIVQEVIIKTLSGIRHWDPRGELLPWLQAQSNSIIDALAKSAPHRHEVSLLEAETSTVTQLSDPLEIILEKEVKKQLEQKVDTLLRIVETEPELKEVLEIILKGCEPKPRHLALELGVPVEDINNRLKRLRRRALISFMHRVP